MVDTANGSTEFPAYRSWAYYYKSYQVLSPISTSTNLVMEDLQREYGLGNWHSVLVENQNFMELEAANIQSWL